MVTKSVAQRIGIMIRDSFSDTSFARFPQLFTAFAGPLQEHCPFWGICCINHFCGSSCVWFEVLLIVDGASPCYLNDFLLNLVLDILP